MFVFVIFIYLKLGKKYQLNQMFFAFYALIWRKMYVELL